jgi:hypothetical protein
VCSRAKRLSLCAQTEANVAADEIFVVVLVVVCVVMVGIMSVRSRRKIDPTE